ncbi:MAG TPA: PepSY domain-containing protein [Iamia sp.]|nr:PepSY domain-containing protein [Iamia sp.]
MSTKINRILIGAAATVGVLAGAAGITAAVTGGGDADPAPTLAREEAEAAAVAEVPGTVVGIEADDEGGRAVWSVDVEGEDGRRHEVDVDDRGDVVGRDVDDDDDDDGDDGDDAPVDPAEATVTQADAEAAALAEVPGTVRSSHLEREDGRLEWDVDVTGDDGRQHDLQIDAETGAVLEHDTDDD